MNVQNPNVAQRAALYLRVSTTRQAEHDVSIPDQRKQGETYCAARGYQLVETFVEAGASATNDRRPEFQRMIEAGTSKPAPFDVVVVHSFSRFFRDHFELEFYVRKLAKNGVKLVSITQEMGDDPMHVMMRQIMALFDEYQSKENAKHVLRAMNENARQGFWNGARPPIGYRIVAAEQRGSKIKKKLEIDPLHAETVRLIYRLFLEGDGTSGPKGVKAIATYLNERRMFTRDGGKWGLAQIHAILTRTTYIGEHRFNTRSHKDREKKPEAEVAVMAVPPLIERETFDAVQARLKSRNPMVVPARVSSGPTLLTGICFCAKCGGAMTLRTGKGNGGQYTYYTCSTKARQGKTGCEGRSIRMDKLDHLVAGHLEDRLLQPKRLETILSSLLDRRQERTERRREHLAGLNRRITETDQRLNRLYDAIESGVAELDDAGLKDRIANLKAVRDQATADAERIRMTLDGSGDRAVTPDMIDALSQVARRRLRIEGGGYRRDHLRAFAQRVEVADDEVRIMGRKSDLLQTLVAASSGETAAFAVRSSVLKWRAFARAKPLMGQRIARPAPCSWNSNRQSARIRTLLEDEAEEDLGRGGGVHGNGAGRRASPGSPPVRNQCVPGPDPASPWKFHLPPCRPAGNQRGYGRGRRLDRRPVPRSVPSTGDFRRPGRDKDEVGERPHVREG
ncbi:recombinase family protein [Roseomonas mucosa]